MQPADATVGAGDADGSEPARLVAAGSELRGDVGQVPVGVLCEPADARAEHTVLHVVRQDVRPSGSEAGGISGLGQRRPLAVGCRRGSHHRTGAVVGGCQVGSGMITPNP